jgi:hypothetical protein
MPNRCSGAASDRFQRITTKEHNVTMEFNSLSPIDNVL